MQLKPIHVVLVLGVYTASSSSILLALLSLSLTPYTKTLHSGISVNYIEAAGYTYLGSDLPTVGSYTIESTFEACASKCNQTSRCVGFSYRNSDSRCWVKSKMEAEKLTLDQNFRSGFVKGTFRMEYKFLQYFLEFSTNF